MDGEVVARPQSLSARWYRLDLPLDSRLLPSLPSPRSPSQASPCLLFFDELDAIVGGSAGETRGGKGHAAEARVRPGPALIQGSLSLAHFFPKTFFGFRRLFMLSSFFSSRSFLFLGGVLHCPPPLPLWIQTQFVVLCESRYLLLSLLCYTLAYPPRYCFRRSSSFISSRLGPHIPPPVFPAPSRPLEPHLSLSCSHPAPCRFSPPS